MAHLQTVISLIVTSAQYNLTQFQAHIRVQNLQFLKQVVPSDPHIFMYCILVNLQLVGEEEETRVLAGLQKMRGSVHSFYRVVQLVRLG